MTIGGAPRQVVLGAPQAPSFAYIGSWTRSSRRSAMTPDFHESVELRSPSALLAEDDRTYDLWCHALAAQRRGENLPNDLNLGVLRERRYAFEWMDGNQDWDEVTCDA
jgi:hypothetical protein